MPELYYIVSFFIIGTFFGSFFNLVGYRLPKKQSIIKPRSACPNCKHKLKGYELIPIISYILQRGKCNKCNYKIPIIYLIYEIISGLIFALLYYRFGFTLELLYAFILTSGLLIIINSDINSMVIPDSVLIITLIGLIIIDAFRLNPATIGTKLFEGMVMFAILFIIKKIGNFLFSEESLGDGDIKLMALIGYILGVINSTTVIFIASFIALIVAIIIMKKSKSNIIAFGPFLAIATLVIYLTNFNLLEYLIK